MNLYEDTHGDGCGCPADQMVADATPTLIDLVRELRRELGLFDGAMSISPKQAWQEAIEVVRGLRMGFCHACEDRVRWDARRTEEEGT